VGAEVLVTSFARSSRLAGSGASVAQRWGPSSWDGASAAVYFFPERLFAIYLIMAVVLLFRPQGLFGRSVRRI
jgi:hypothetical protein